MIKKNLKNNLPRLYKVLSFFKSKIAFNGSVNYWENRYKNGGNSGSGSYGRLAKFKSDIINGFVEEYQIEKIIEFGSGDGNQLTLANYSEYIGLDVSETCISSCQERFKTDLTKQFFVLIPSLNLDEKKFKADLVLSLDVLFHLVEKKVFEDYLHKLFNASLKYVIIYSSNTNDEGAPHVKHRLFSSYIEYHFPEFQLIKIIKNKYPYDKTNLSNTSFSDFYFYQRINS